MGSNASFGCLHFFCFQGQSKEICKIFGLLVSGHTNHRRCQMHASQLFSLIQHMEVGMAKVSAVKVFLLEFHADARLPVSKPTNYSPMHSGIV